MYPAIILPQRKYFVSVQNIRRHNKGLQMKFSDLCKSESQRDDCEVTGG